MGARCSNTFGWCREHSVLLVNSSRGTAVDTFEGSGLYRGPLRRKRVNGHAYVEGFAYIKWAELVIIMPTLGNVITG